MGKLQRYKMYKYILMLPDKIVNICTCNLANTYYFIILLDWSGDSTHFTYNDTNTNCAQ